MAVYCSGWLTSSLQISTIYDSSYYQGEKWTIMTITGYSTRRLQRLRNNRRSPVTQGTQGLRATLRL